MNQNEEIISENQESAENLAGNPDASQTQAGNGQAAELAKLQAELGEQKDKFIRLYSEFENFRRRTAKEKLDMIQTANEQLLKTLLPVADDFERAEKSFRVKSDKELEGFFLIHNKFKKTLDQAGLKVMDLKSGSDFNADLHEAITQVPVTDDSMHGKVVDVVENGYLLNDKVVRHAKVVIGNK
ncbi:MAG: nucleotide exchange factor GrpE [Chryseolinea sp.]